MIYITNNCTTLKYRQTLLFFYTKMKSSPNNLYGAYLNIMDVQYKHSSMKKSASIKLYEQLFIFLLEHLYQ